MDPYFLSLIFVTILFSEIAESFNFGPHPRERHPSICTPCPPGTGILFNCNSTHDTICQACITGRTFSPSNPHTAKCQPCSLCGPGLYVDKKCEVMSDTLCDACQNKRSSFSLEYMHSCHTGRRENSLLPVINDDKESREDIPPDQETNLEILREELQLRNEVGTLRSKVDDEAVMIKELGSALHRLLDVQKSTSEIPVKIPPKGSYERNPKTVLAVVILISFGILSLGTVGVIWMLLNWNRRRQKSKSYGGAKTSHDGLTLLQVEVDSLAEDEAM